MVYSPNLYTSYDAIVKANNRLIAAKERGMITDYARLLKELKSTVANAYELYAEEGRLNFTELQRYNRIRQLKNELDGVVDKGTKPIFRKVEDGLKTVTEESYAKSISAINTIANSNVGPELSAGQIQDILNTPWSGLTMEERIGLRRTDIGRRVTSSTVQGIIRGETYEEMAARLKDETVKDILRTKQMTEDMAHQVQNDAFVRSFKDVAEEDIEITKTWVTAGDANVRDAHAAMDGQTVAADEPFVVPSGEFKGAEAQGPGLFGEPALDRFCRCWVVAGVRKRTG